MYGLVGKITAVNGQRDALAQILRDGTQNMPGCQSYVIADCMANSDVLWVTEIWENPDFHLASLQLPVVQAAIGKGRPLISGIDRIATTQIV